VSSPNVESYKYYLEDLGYLLKEYALEAKQAFEAHRTSRDEDHYFYMGQLLAYHRVISLMQQQAVGFGIPVEDLRLDNIEPDRDLV
jgi:hypothetical protein